LNRDRIVPIVSPEVATQVRGAPDKKPATGFPFIVGVSISFTEAGEEKNQFILLFVGGMISFWEAIRRSWKELGQAEDHSELQLQHGLDKAWIGSSGSPEERTEGKDERPQEAVKRDGTSCVGDRQE